MGHLALFPEQFAKEELGCFNWLHGPKRFLDQDAFFHAFILTCNEALDDKHKSQMHQINVMAEREPTG